MFGAIFFKVWTLLSNIQTLRIFFSNCVAFSKYLNFTHTCNIFTKNEKIVKIKLRGIRIFSIIVQKLF